MQGTQSQQRSYPPGTLVAERYRLERSIGSGGMGSVYLATDEVLKAEKVAIKILHKDLLSDERQTQRFLREVQLMRRINHVNVVRTFDVGSDNDLYYFTMEFVPGRSLEDFLETGGYPLNRISRLVIEVAEGLAAIHRAGVIHRDLKPANILVLEDGTAKITDFGVARPEYSDLTAHNEIVGSALYIAPEIWLGTKLTASVDLYSLGVMLYELTTGILPFEGDSPAALMRMHLEYEPEEPKALNKDIPAWLNKLILRLLAKSIVDRPKDATEVADYVRLQTSVASRISKEQEGKGSASAQIPSPQSKLGNPTPPRVTMRGAMKRTIARLVVDREERFRGWQVEFSSRLVPTFGFGIATIALYLLLLQLFVIAGNLLSLHTADSVTAAVAEGRVVPYEVLPVLFSLLPLALINVATFAVLASLVTVAAGSKHLFIWALIRSFALQAFLWVALVTFALLTNEASIHGLTLLTVFLTAKQQLLQVGALEPIMTQYTYHGITEGLVASADRYTPSIIAVPQVLLVLAWMGWLSLIVRRTIYRGGLAPRFATIATAIALVFMLALGALIGSIGLPQRPTIEQEFAVLGLGFSSLLNSLALTVVSWSALYLLAAFFGIVDAARGTKR